MIFARFNLLLEYCIVFGMPLVAIVLILNGILESNGSMEWFGIIDLSCQHIDMKIPSWKMP